MYLIARGIAIGFSLVASISSLSCDLFGSEGNEVYTIRKATWDDGNALKELYQRVASNEGGLARTKDEITQEYIEEVLIGGINNGIAFVVDLNGRLIGSMIKYKWEPEVFSHMLVEGSILIDPDFQNRGIGSDLIRTFQRYIEENRPDILRIEINVRESNPAINLYKRLGFKEEGRFERRIRDKHGKLETDVSMVWFNKNFVDAKGSYDIDKEIQ